MHDIEIYCQQWVAKEKGLIFLLFFVFFFLTTGPPAAKDTNGQSIGVGAKSCQRNNYMYTC